MVSVFLSYARGDDDGFVERAYRLLLDRGFDVWWDRACMPSRALTFTEEIRDAIHRCDRLAVVIGPKALRSEYVRAEWQAALSEHKPVVPVLRRIPDGVVNPYDVLPGELRMQHAPSFVVVEGVEPPLDELARVLAEPVPPPPPIFGGPPERPPHFRPRPAQFQALFEAVLGELSGPRVSRNEERVTVLTGMGGMGKTVMAAGLVEALRSRPSTFLHDGVYWLSGPTALQRLATLCRVTPSGALDEQHIEDALAQHLEGKRFLLVVDDATAVQQIAPLIRVLGAGGRMLVTARDRSLAVGHRHIALEELPERDALALMADWLGTSPDALPAGARQVVSMVGRHPFAIAVNAAAATQGLPWSTIVHALKQHDLDFAVHRFEEYVYATVDQSLQISVDALPPSEQEHYRALAAFYWDSGVPVRVVERFWAEQTGLAEHHAERLLVTLRQRSLIDVRGAAADREVHLHALHATYLHRDRDATASLMAALLESYQAPQPDEWWRVPDDGYIHRHLVRHLLHARSADHVRALLCAEDDDGRNLWFRTRTGTAAKGLTGYLDDVERAAPHVPATLTALVTASLRSLSWAVPGPLLGAAVRAHVLSVQSARVQARLIPDPASRAAAVAALLEHAPDRDDLLAEALDAVEAVQLAGRSSSVDALVESARPTELPVILGVVVEWTARASSPFEKGRATALVQRVLARVPPELAGAAVELAEGVGVQAVRLYGWLPAPQRSQRVAVAVVRARAEQRVDGLPHLALLVGRLAEHLEPGELADLVDEAYAWARAMKPGVLRRAGLRNLLALLPSTARREAFRELLAAAREHPKEFASLAKVTPPEWHEVIRHAVEGLDWLDVANVAPALGSPHREALTEQALTAIEHEGGAADAFANFVGDLIPLMDGSQRERARRAITADAGAYGLWRTRALTAVARASEPEEREAVVDDVLTAIDALAGGEERERALRTVAPLLTQRQLMAALGSAQRIGEPSGVGHLVELLPFLSAPTCRRALVPIARSSPALSLTTWRRLLQQLPVAGDQQALGPLVALARDRQQRLDDPTVLVALAALLPELTHEAREAVLLRPPGPDRLELLLDLDGWVAAEQDLLRWAATLEPEDVARSVAGLAAHLAPDRRRHWTDWALAADNGRRKFVLETLAPHLDQVQSRTYLARTLVPDEPTDLMALVPSMDLDLPYVPADDEGQTAACLAARLGELGDAEAAFDMVSVGRDDAVTARALVELATHLTRDRVLQVEARILAGRYGGLTVTSADGAGRRGNVEPTPYLTGRLAPALARVGEIDRARAYARATDVTEWRVAAYLGIAEATSGTTRRCALLDALSAVLDVVGRYGSQQGVDVAYAMARDAGAAEQAWPRVVAWARTRRRHEAIAGLATFAPVAASLGGSASVDEVFDDVARVMRWWP